MKEAWHLLLAAPVLLAVGSQPVAAAPVLDVNNLITGIGLAGWYANGSVHASQSFTVGLTGYLSAIDVFARVFGNRVSGVVGLDVYRGGTANAPGTSLISTSYLAASSTPAEEAILTFNFNPTAIAVTAGDVLTFRMSASQGTYLVNNTQMADGRTSNGYAGGYLYGEYGDGFATSALNFRTFVDRSPLPESATWAMMLLGFGGLGHAMRRRDRAAARIRFV